MADSSRATIHDKHPPPDKSEAPLEGFEETMDSHHQMLMQLHNRLSQVEMHLGITHQKGLSKEESHPGATEKHTARHQREVGLAKRKRH